MREIKLDGGEITVLKALGLAGTPVVGKMLISRAGGMESAELIETLNGLINLDYVTSSKVNISQIEEVEHAYFRVNPTYARELRDVLRGGRHREEPQRRRRRRG